MTTSGKPACSATAVSSSTDPANQNGDGRQAELVGGQPPHALPVLRHPHAAGGREHLEAALRGGDQRVDRNDAGLGDHVERVGPLDDRGERLGVVHLDHRRAIGHTVSGRIRIPVDGHHLTAQPLERQGQLSAQLTGAEQHHRASVVALRSRLAVGRLVVCRVLEFR